MKEALNFEVGQAGELKSFLTGFRGAWFRFKIIDILPKQNKIKLKYLDYDDDGIQTEMIYQVPPYSTKLNPSNKHLMIRPCYPLMYHKNTMPSVISEVCVVTNGSWKVKDLVDSFGNGCFWTGRVTKVLSEEKVQIEYPLPPAGEEKEDETYEAFCKDLRPSLVWSQEEGWTLPTVDGRTAGDAQLIFPSQQGTDSEREEANDAEQVGDSPLDAYGTGTSNETRISLDSLVEGETEMRSSEAMGVAVCKDVKKDDLESIDSISIIGVQESNAAAAAFEKGTDSEKEEVDDAEAVGDSPLDAYGNGTSNGTGISLDSLVEGETKIQKAMDAAVCKDVKMDDLESIESNATAFEEGIEYRIDLNMMHEETLEAPILDLEELANKIRWIKSILQRHQPPSNDKTPWKFA